MSINEKAVANLKQKGLNASIQYDSVYITINNTSLELSPFEIGYQAKDWDEVNAEPNLIDQVIERVKKDVEVGDVTALEDLLKNVDTNHLKSYLPEK